MTTNAAAQRLFTAYQQGRPAMTKDSGTETGSNDEGQERHDVTITYTNGDQDHFPGVDGDTARDLENAAFTLPGVVVVVEAQAQR